MSKLRKIEKKELLFENVPLRDRINTELRLEDTDWMNYKLLVSFQTCQKENVEASFEYYGTKESELRIEYNKQGKVQKFILAFPSELFEKYLIQFMKLHLAQWENQTVFYGGDLALEFYNEVLEVGSLLES